MKLIQLFAIALLVLLGNSAYAQSMNLASGNLDFLKGQKTVNLVYAYDNLRVGPGTEQEYIDKKVNGYNKDKPGHGDEWLKNWKNDRPTRYQPKFEELINKQLEKPGVKVGNFPNAPYTLILRTTFIEPGFNVYMARRPANTNLEAAFVKTGTTAELAVITMMKSPGRDALGYDFDSGERISESYAKAGKSLANFLIKAKVM